jgi:hypothetical protein
MKIIRINSMLVLILEFDQIPITELAFGTPQYIKDTLQFRSVQVKEEQGRPSISYRNGRYNSDDKKISVKRVNVDERKILIEVDGPSSNADQIWMLLKKQFRQLTDPEVYNDKPVIRSRESVLIAQMDVEAKDLIHPGLLKTIENEVLDASSREYANADFSYFQIAARLDYLITDQIMKEYRIDITPKVFTLEPRDGTALEDRIFLSRAPVDTPSHISILEKIESQFSKQ